MFAGSVTLSSEASPLNRLLARVRATVLPSANDMLVMLELTNSSLSSVVTFAGITYSVSPMGMNTGFQSAS